MTILAIVIGLIVVGVIFMLRPPRTPEVAPVAMTDADAAALREAVLGRLRDRLVGWNLETPEDQPLHISAREVGSEKRIEMNLDRLGEAWFPHFAARRLADADETVEAFVAGVTGQSDGTDVEADESGLRSALALRLVPVDKVPKAGLQRPAGALAAVLVLRRPDGPDVVSADDLATMNLSEADAFRTAHENLCRDVEEGIEIESLDERHPKDAISLAPGDVLATSYALVPTLAAKIRKSLGNRDGRLYLDADGLVATVEGVEIERGPVLLAEAVAPDALAWTAVPG